LLRRFLEAIIRTETGNSIFDGDDQALAGGFLYLPNCLLIVRCILVKVAALFRRHVQIFLFLSATRSTSHSKQEFETGMKICLFKLVCEHSRFNAHPAE